MRASCPLLYIENYTLKTMSYLHKLTCISTICLTLGFSGSLPVMGYSFQELLSPSHEVKKVQGLQNHQMILPNVEQAYIDFICNLIPYLCKTETQNTLPQNTLIPNGLRLVVEVQTTPSIPKITERELAAVKQVIENRIQRLGISQATVQIQGKNQILILLPRVKDPKQVIRILESSGKLEFKEQKIGTENQLNTLKQTNNELTEKQREFRQSNSLDQNAIAKNAQALQQNNLAISKLFKTTNPPLTGRNIKDAFSQSTQSSYIQEITIQFDEKGSQTFTKVTKNIAGTGRAIGIFIDDKLISSPIVDVIFAKTGITGGSAVISGAFTAQYAQNIALQLKSGALPLPLKVIESTSIKPGK
jgi:preprotein translocase subunit SecD